MSLSNDGYWLKSQFAFESIRPGDSPQSVQKPTDRIRGGVLNQQQLFSELPFGELSSMWLRSFAILFSACLTAGTLRLHADDANGKSISKPAGESQLWQQVESILQQNCLRCHGPEDRDGGLRLTGREHLFILNDSGEPAIVADKSGESELIRRVSATGDERMPPPEEGAGLTQQQIGILSNWIDAGATWPRESTEDEPIHWAYVKPVQADPPVVKQVDLVKNPIDGFVLAQLEKLNKGLTPSPTAKRARLLRRLYLDLIGMPPTPQHVDEFVNDPSPDAYERVVDRLLDSPAYGEKWARSWLDAARYADSNGFQADQFRSMWLYRDWVINAINDDMPFDQFTIEQIAGDLIPGSSLEQKVATGFHRCTTCNVEAGVDPEENRVNQIFDRVNTTGVVWLGTTFECAQCHNHKYDPISQQEYYQIFAYFNNTPLEVEQEGETVTYNFYGPKLRIPLTQEQLEERSVLGERRLELGCRIELRQHELLIENRRWEQETIAALERGETVDVPDDVQEILKTPRQKRTIKQLKEFSDFLDEQDALCFSMLNELKQVKKELVALTPPTSLVMQEQSEPRLTQIFMRGEFLSKGAEVQPAIPAALNTSSETGKQDRLSLARWLVSPDNPLVARVTVNRWWSEFFGRGIVTTLEDFGRQGEPPTHPRLLDWLAVEFMNNGWSMKRLHKTIVTSATYQQSSRITPKEWELDAENKWYARGPRFRLSAEAIRDSALAISGLASHKMEGSPVYPPQPAHVWRHVGRGAPTYNTSTGLDRYRRGVYVIWRRSAPYPSFVNFDAPDRGACVVSRSRTNTPLQALTLLNDPAYVEIAIGFARRLEMLERETGAPLSDRNRIELAMKLCVSRQPDVSEIDYLLDLFVRETERFDRDPQSAKALLGEAADSTEISLSRWAAWFTIANTLLNLDETVTKG